MTVLSQDRRNALWFGTLERMGWVPTPNSGASVATEGWNAGGTLLSGGGYQLGSFSSHKNYIFEWPSSSSRTAAQLIKSYYDGTYGRGLIYFIDPLTYDTNILPAMWADPSMGIAQESSTLVPGVEPIPVATPGGATLRLPVTSALYDLSGVGVTGPSFLNDSNSVFIPIPSGHELHLGAIYSSTGTGGVYYSEVSSSGSISGTHPVSPLPVSGPTLFNVDVAITPWVAGIRLWVGKTSPVVSTVTLTAMSARLSRQGSPVGGEPFWIGGQGHSGCRFMGPPTYVNMTGVNGGQVSYAASFREVGSWVIG